MTRLALAAILVATTAQAEPVSLSFYADDGDTAELRMESTAVGVLTYSNTALQRSTTGTWDIASKHVVCRLTIAVGAAETATVDCGPGWQVEPTSADVPDGEVFHFVVTWMGG